MKRKLFLLLFVLTLALAVIPAQAAEEPNVEVNQIQVFDTLTTADSSLTSEGLSVAFYGTSYKESIDHAASQHSSSADSMAYADMKQVYEDIATGFEAFTSSSGEPQLADYTLTVNGQPVTNSYYKVDFHMASSNGTPEQQARCMEIYYIAYSAWVNDNPYASSIVTDLANGYTVAGGVRTDYGLFRIIGDNTDIAKAYLSALSNAVGGVKDKFDQECENATVNERFRWIHDYLCDNLEYNHTSLTWSSSDEKYLQEYTGAHNAYGALVGVADPDNAAEGKKPGWVVCEGYADAFLLLCQELSTTGEKLPCVFVSGVGHNSGTAGGSGGHAWNNIQIEGQWYGVDCTWDDGGGSGIAIKNQGDVAWQYTIYKPYAYFGDNSDYYTGTGSGSQKHEITNQVGFLTSGEKGSLSAPSMSTSENPFSAIASNARIECENKASVIPYYDISLRLNTLPALQNSSEIELVLPSDVQFSSRQVSLDNTSCYYYCVVPANRKYTVRGASPGTTLAWAPGAVVGTMFKVEPGAELVLKDFSLPAEAAVASEGLLTIQDVTVPGGVTITRTDGKDSRFTVAGACTADVNLGTGTKISLNRPITGSNLRVTHYVDNVVAEAAFSTAFSEEDFAACASCIKKSDGTAFARTGSQLRAGVHAVGKLSFSAGNLYELPGSSLAWDEEDAAVFAAFYQGGRLLRVAGITTGKTITAVPGNADSAKVFMLNSTDHAPVNPAVTFDKTGFTS